MVLHIPQVIPTALLIPVSLHEPLLILESQHHSKDNQELFHDLLMDALRERLDRAPVLSHDVRVGPAGMLGDELRDVVDLKVVLDARDEVASPGRLPAVVVALLEGGAVRGLG